MRDIKPNPMKYHDFLQHFSRFKVWDVGDIYLVRLLDYGSFQLMNWWNSPRTCGNFKSHNEDTYSIKRNGLGSLVERVSHLQPHVKVVKHWGFHTPKLCSHWRELSIPKTV